MAELMVVGIDDRYDADRILAEMNRIDAGRSQEAAGEEGLAGLIMPASMQSAVGGSLRASGEDLTESLSDCGIEQGFVLSLAEMLETDTPALFLVVRQSQTGIVLAELSGVAGRVLRSPVAVDQIPRLQSALSRITAPETSRGGDRG